MEPGVIFNKKCFWYFFLYFLYFANWCFGPIPLTGLGNNSKTKMSNNKQVNLFKRVIFRLICLGKNKKYTNDNKNRNISITSLGNSSGKLLHFREK